MEFLTRFGEVREVELRDSGNVYMRRKHGQAKNATFVKKMKFSSENKEEAKLAGETFCVTEVKSHAPKHEGHGAPSFGKLRREPGSYIQILYNL